MASDVSDLLTVELRQELLIQFRMSYVKMQFNLPGRGNILHADVTHQSMWLP